MVDVSRSTNLTAGIAVALVAIALSPTVRAENGGDGRLVLGETARAIPVEPAAVDLPPSQGLVAKVPLPLPRPDLDVADVPEGAAAGGEPRARTASVPLPPARPVVLAMLAPAEAVAVAVPVVSSAVAVGAESIRALIARHAAANGVPAPLADAVVKHESRYNPKARNGAYIGLTQISLPTARSLGYDGSAAGLADANTNLTYGVRYLAQAWRLAGGDTCRTILKYQAGHRAETMTAAARSYCASVAQAARTPERGNTIQTSGATAGDDN